MTYYIHKTARMSAILGGVVLTALALMMMLSIVGGSISKIAYSDWLSGTAPDMAEWLKATGIRTIPGMYEVIAIGVAFVLFSFLPITQLEQGHAVVDIFTSFLPKRPNQFIVAVWDLIFFVALVVMTWRLWYGAERLMRSGMIYQDLQIPQWWGYAVAFVQMTFASIVAAYTAWAQWVKLFTGREILPKPEGMIH